MTASMIASTAPDPRTSFTNDINVRAAVKVRIATDDDTLFKAATRNLSARRPPRSPEVRDYRQK